MKLLKKLPLIALATTVFIGKMVYGTPSPSSCLNLLEKSTPQLSCCQQKGKAPNWNEVVRFKSAGKYKVTWRAEFNIKETSDFSGLSLTKPDAITHLKLNGNPIRMPERNMIYDTVPVPISMLKKGNNRLEAQWQVTVKLIKDRKTARVSYKPAMLKASDTKISLAGLTASELKFQTGPLLGYAGTDFFTVTCRVNIPATLTLSANGHKIVSPPALLHNFKVKRLKADTAYKYTITATLPSGDTITTKPYIVRTLPKKTPFKFAVLGDSRSHPKDWKKVAEATRKEQPILSVFVGDMVTNGHKDRLWDNEYWAPAKDFLATIPYFSIIGNHEGNDPIFTKLFMTPTGGNEWTQQVGPVLLIGIDGSKNWTKGSKLAQWLEKILSHSKAKYIFLFSHYPAWTSGYHGTLSKTTGHPREKTIKNAQDTIMPLLEKYHATAMFSGHDHFYERSEPPKGVSMIVTGGAGAPLRDKVKNAEKQNPYSKVFCKKLHYCILSVNTDACKMRAITPDGEVIDTWSWPARKVK